MYKIYIYISIIQCTSFIAIENESDREKEPYINFAKGTERDRTNKPKTNKFYTEMTENAEQRQTEMAREKAQE